MFYSIKPFVGSLSALCIVSSTFAASDVAEPISDGLIVASSFSQSEMLIQSFDDVNFDGVNDILGYSLNDNQLSFSIFSGSVFTELSSFSVSHTFNRATFHILQDTNSDNIREVGLFGLDTELNRYQLFVFDGVTGKKQGVWNWPNTIDNATFESLDDLTADGIEEYAITGVHSVNGTRQLVVKNGATKGAYQTFKWPNIFDDTKIVTMSDVTGDGIPEVALYGKHQKMSKGQLFAFDGSNANIKLDVYNWNPQWTNLTLFEMDDVDGEGTIDWGQFGKRIDDGRYQWVIKKGHNKQGVIRTFSWPSDLVDVQPMLVDDRTRDGVRDVAISGMAADTGKYFLRINDGRLTNQRIANISWPANWTDVQIEELGDLNNDGLNEYALLGYLKSNGKAQLIIKDGSTFKEYGRYSLPMVLADLKVSSYDVDADNIADVIITGNSVVSNVREAYLLSGLSLEVIEQVDADLDGVIDTVDEFPEDKSEWRDTDGDGIGNNADIDDDNDDVIDSEDALPLDASESVDTDMDGIGDNADTDRDGDGVLNDDDAFDLDPTESVDTDMDGIGNNADTDRDGDGVLNDDDAFDLDPTESVDTDSDGIGNNADTDRDGDGVLNDDDAFDLDPTESVDSDSDGIGNNADTDRDGDGVLNDDDAFDLDPTESVDTDSDGIGNNADTDRDGDGVLNEDDAFDLDPTESVDTDSDGIGNNADTDRDGDGVLNDDDAFDLDPTESVDSDSDGIGNNADTDRDGDGVLNDDDAFDLDPTESVDTDFDGIGNNADTDRDGDGVLNDDDAFDLDPTESVDTDSDGIGNNADTDRDGDGVLNDDDAFDLDPTESVDTDKDGLGDNSDLVVNEDGVLTKHLLPAIESNSGYGYLIVEEPSHGNYTLSDSGMFEYRPNENFFGSDTFKVKITSDIASIIEKVYFIDVVSVNDAPIIKSVTTSTRLNEAVVIELDATDVDDENIDLTITKQPEHGTAVLNDNGTVTYTPNAEEMGLDSFEVSASDSKLTSTAIITIDNDLSYAGYILEGDITNAEAILTGDKHLIRTKIDENGEFKFYGLPDGEYSVKVRKNGYKSSPAKEFVLGTSQVSNMSLFNNEADNSYTLEEITSDEFLFHWEEDQSTAGYDYSAHVNTPLEIEFLDEVVEVVDDSAANKLQHDYNILLVDSADNKWSQEHAYRISETMQTIPQNIRNPYKEQELIASKWMLTAEYLANDIEIVEESGFKTVYISEAAFVNAAPKMAKVEGKRGLYFSQRLHHALVRFVTNNGTDEAAYEKILTERFGVSTLVPDYLTLTQNTTYETSSRFQAFHAEEIVEIINMFEEMPSGMHKLPELKYLIRRLDGTPHPLYVSAPAVAWPDSGYIEFMDSAFLSSSIEHTHRLIIHEKSHFLWVHQFDNTLKQDWIDLGGWYEDSAAQSGWSTTKQTEFVSAYAHSKNPNEDMAESISYFILNPDKLKSRAFAKYEFVRDRIMQGNIYISEIREDLTFQVYNLYPDYVFPGKIKRVDIQVVGAADEDKTVSIEIGLHGLNTEVEGAKNAYMRLHSEIGTFKDLYLYPIDETGLNLKGSFQLSKFAKSGLWRPEQIIVTDNVGNQRMEGVNDYGWKLYINNVLEDFTRPEYVENSALLEKYTTEIEGQEVQVIKASWSVEEERMDQTYNACYATLNDSILSTYRIEEYDSFNEDNQRCEVEIIMPHYMPSSVYSMNYISMVDIALNERGTFFSTPTGGREEHLMIDEAPQQIELITNTPDIEAPELDINNLFISAVPTNIEQPNGETEVTITYTVKDNISGYKHGSLYLRDPQGITHQFWAYHDEGNQLFPSSDVGEWKTYTRTIILPPGSAPGTWGLSEMKVYDRAANFKAYDFTEIIHFEVVE